MPMFLATLEDGFAYKWQMKTIVQHTLRLITLECLNKEDWSAPRGSSLNKFNKSLSAENIYYYIALLHKGRRQRGISLWGKMNRDDSFPWGCIHLEKGAN